MTIFTKVPLRELKFYLTAKAEGRIIGIGIHTIPLWRNHVAIYWSKGEITTIRAIKLLPETHVTSTKKEAFRGQYAW
jgi:hypothetical protein